jgi:hypothetical protein
VTIKAQPILNGVHFVTKLNSSGVASIYRLASLATDVNKLLLSGGAKTLKNSLLKKIKISPIIACNSRGRNLEKLNAHI